MNKTVLVIGSGGREHALALTFKKAPEVSRVLVTPGNGGTAVDAENIVCDLKPESVLALVESESVDLVWIGPEAPLTEGLADFLRAKDIAVVGPLKACAALEGDKGFSKSFMQEFSIPTAQAVEVTSLADAKKALAEFPTAPDKPIVIKATGLAAGKGVSVCPNHEEALVVLEEFLEKGTMGQAGERVLIEEFMPGEEATLLLFVSGDTAIPMPASQDHKRLLEGDKGPNTGGMGAYGPAPVLTPEILEKVMTRIVQPTLGGLKNRGLRYDGILYVGLMIDQGEPRVVEYNVRFGDPETQVVLPMLRTSLFQIAMAILDGSLDSLPIQFDTRPTATVVLASQGYPGDYAKGKAISGPLYSAGPVQVFQAGTVMKDGQLLSSGGRVMAVSAQANTLKEALTACYNRVEKISYEGKIFRRDIAWRAKG